VFFSLKADSLFPRRLKSRFTKTKPASWEVEEKREHSLTKDQAKDKEKSVVVPRRTPVRKTQRLVNWKNEYVVDIKKLCPTRPVCKQHFFSQVHIFVLPVCYSLKKSTKN
jgi:hypothetical protein